MACLGWHARWRFVAPSADPGTALHFNGTNSFVNIPHSSTLNAYPLAITAWVRTLRNASQPNAVVACWSTTYGGFILESSADLAANSAWTEIDGPNFLAGGHHEYHEAKSSLWTKKFFRPRYPGIFFLTPPEAELSFQLQTREAVLIWPADFAGYTLESTPDLAPPALRTPVARGYGLTNGQFEFRQNLLNTKPREFFRLRWP